MNIRTARTALATELLSREPNVVAVGLGECADNQVLTVLLDGATSTSIPESYQGFEVQVISSGTFSGSRAAEAMAS